MKNKTDNKTDSSLKYTIYKTTNLIDNKFYIGKHQTKYPEDDYLGSGKHLKRAIKKYGQENFNKEIFFIFDNEKEMNLKEKELVTEEFCKRKDTYNICLGGQGGFSYINKNKLNGNSFLIFEVQNKAYKTRIKKFLKKWSSDKKFKKKQLLFLKKANKIRMEIYPEGTFKGKAHSEETKKKMSLVRKGKKNRERKILNLVPSGSLMELTTRN